MIDFVRLFHSPAFLHLCITVPVNIFLVFYLSRYGSRSRTVRCFRVYLMWGTIYALSHAGYMAAATEAAFSFWHDIYFMSLIAMGITLMVFGMYYTSNERILSRLWFQLPTAAIALTLLWVQWATDLFRVHSLDASKLIWNAHEPTTGSLFQILSPFILLPYVITVVTVFRYYRHVEEPLKRKETKIVLSALVLMIAPGVITEGVLPQLTGTHELASGVFFGAIAYALIVYAVTRYGIYIFNINAVGDRIAQMIPGGIVMLDHTNTIQYANNGVGKMLGYKPEQLVGTSFKKLVANPSDYDSLKQLASKHGSDHITIEGKEIELLTKDHIPLFATLNSADIYEGRKYTNTLITLADITELKQTQNQLTLEKASVEQKVIERTTELQKEQAKLQASIQSLSLGFIMVDNENRIILSNEACQKMLGVDTKPSTLQDLAGHFSQNVSLEDLCSDIRRQKTAQLLKTITPDNKMLRVYLAPVMHQQTMLGLVIVLEDITEQEVMNRSKDEFFSIASHELRTPLTAIRGNAGMLLDLYKEQLKDKDAQEMLGDIHQSSLRLIDIVNDFLDMSRLEQGKVTFAYESVALDEVIELVVYEMHAILQEKHLSLEFNHKTLGDLPKVWADKNRLKQIIYNLIGNAAKFTEEGGIHIDVDREDAALKVKVTDTGRGISPDGQRLLFHKFQQAGNSLLTRDTARGTGLGLYISKMMVESMGGRITLEHSKEGEGSCFSFTIPIAANQEHEPVAAEAAPINTETGLSQPATINAAASILTDSTQTGSNEKPKTHKLLIVEDDPYVLRLYQRLFNTKEIELKTALNGKDGYALAQTFQPDLILLDMMMPVMNGLDTLKLLKKNPKTEHIPVFMLSNLGEEKAMQEAMAAGAASYLLKSNFAPEELMSAIHQQLGQKAPSKDK